MHFLSPEARRLLDLKQVEAPEAVLEFLYVFTLLGQELVVVERLVDDDAEHPADEGSLAAGAWAQPNIGEPGKLSLSLVDDDQFGTLFNRLLDGNGRDVLLLGDVARHDEEALRAFEVADRVCGGAVAEHRFQRRE